MCVDNHGKRGKFRDYVLTAFIIEFERSKVFMCWIECTRWSSDADPHIPGELRLRIGRKEAIFCNSERLVIWKEFITMKKDNLSEPVPRGVVDPQGVTHSFSVGTKQKVL